MKNPGQIKASHTNRPWIRSGVILAIIEFLEREGHDAKAILGDSAFHMAEASNAYRQVDLEFMWQIFQAAVDATGRHDWCLRLGLEADLAQLGPWGFSFINAPTLGDALWDFVRYGPTFQTHTLWGMNRGKKRTHVEYCAYRKDLTGWEVDAEVSVAYIMGIVNSLCRTRITPLEIHMDHAPMCDDNVYVRHLGIKPYFNRKTNRIFYPSELMKKAVAGADPNLYRIICRHLDDLAASMPSEYSMTELVSNNIRRGLGSDTVGLDHVAAELGLNPRTLQRRLVDEGTSFQEVFDRVRFDVARYYLERTTFDVLEIAIELGYSQPSTFNRAFKRWTGATPGAYRTASRT